MSRHRDGGDRDRDRRLRSREGEQKRSCVSKRDRLSRRRSPPSVLSVCPGAGAEGAATVPPPRGVGAEDALDAAR